MRSLLPPPRGMGVWVVWMSVPRGRWTGSSPDFDSGPIVPNTVLPIHVEATATHNGQPFSTLAAFDVPALDSNLGFGDVDGHSHFPIFRPTTPTSARRGRS